VKRAAQLAPDRVEVEARQEVANQRYDDAQRPQIGLDQLSRPAPALSIASASRRRGAPDAPGQARPRRSERAEVGEGILDAGTEILLDALDDGRRRPAGTRLGRDSAST
jgi:hypothetical protein